MNVETMSISQATARIMYAVQAAGYPVATTAYQRRRAVRLVDSCGTRRGVTVDASMDGPYSRLKSYWKRLGYETAYLGETSNSRYRYTLIARWLAK